MIRKLVLFIYATLLISVNLFSECSFGDEVFETPAGRWVFLGEKPFEPLLSSKKIPVDQELNYVYQFTDGDEDRNTLPIFQVEVVRLTRTYHSDRPFDWDNDTFTEMSWDEFQNFRNSEPRSYRVRLGVVGSSRIDVFANGFVVEFVESSTQNSSGENVKTLVLVSLIYG